MLTIFKNLQPLYKAEVPSIHRSLSSDVVTPLLKSRLRSLFKKVHPDLFHGETTAAEKEVNERSFKLLQEYLAAAEHGNAGIGGATSLPYRFIFYVKGHHASGVHGTHHKVSLTLPPPSKSLPRSTHQALDKLLTACGVEGIAEQDMAHGESAITLRSWIPAAAERFYQAGSQQGGPSHELSAIRAALQMTRRISLLFGGALSKAGTLPQLDAAQALLGVLGGCPPEVMGLRIGLGDAFGTEPTGAVWLHAEAQPETWVEFFRGADLAWCHAQRARSLEVITQQRSAAKALGVGMVVAGTDAILLSEAHAEFLRQITHAEISKASPLPLPGLVRVSLLIGPGVEAHSDGQGKVILPETATAADAVAALKRWGSEAALCAELAAREHADLASLRSQVERKLRLRQLVRGYLPAHKFKAGCMRLLQHADTLRPSVEGLPLRLAEVYSFRPDSAYIDVAWDFVP